MTLRTLPPWLDDLINNTTPPNSTFPTPPLSPPPLPTTSTTIPGGLSMQDFLNDALGTIPSSTTIPSTTIPPIPSTTKGIDVNNNNNTLILIWSVSLLVLTLLILFVYIRHTSYNRKLKNIELQHRIQTEKYKLEVLEKSKIDNVHVEEMEKINFSLLKETRDYEYTHIQDERGFILAQQKIDAQNGKNILDAVMPLMQQQNSHQIDLAKIKGSLDQIFEDDNVSDLNIKKK